LGVIVQAVLIGMVVALAGTVPRNLIFAANLRYFPAVPWAIPVTAAYLWLFWWYLNGSGPPQSTADERRASLRANRVSGRAWAWALCAGGLGIVALVVALRVVNRLVALPEQHLPDMAGIPKVLSSLCFSSALPSPASSRKRRSAATCRDPSSAGMGWPSQSW
jgi:hypothetical protein